MLIFVLIGTVYICRIFEKIGRGFRTLRLGMDKMGKTASNGGIDEPIKIVFSKDEKQHCVDVSGKNVTVVGSAGKHDHGSSKIKLKNIVDYKWELKNYPGHLIACHRGGKLIAYAITVNHRATPEGMVRIVDLSLGQRALIKNMSDEVLDLQFAHISSKIILAVIEQAVLRVFTVAIVNEKIVCTVLLIINDPIDSHIPVCDKIAWCPYLQDNGYEDEYASQLLVWTRGDVFQCYSISAVAQHYDCWFINAKDITEGGFKVNLPNITGAVFSADGTTLAVSCDEGVIRFYQIYQHTNDNNLRCLHQWKPHGGKTISSFFFLDNYTEQGADQVLWKHAITCSDNNTEIKVWSCETWECTQTINFVPSIDQPLNFKAEIDRTSSFLVLSDITTREMYVLQVRKETIRSDNGTDSSVANGNSDANFDRSKEGETKPNEQNATSSTTISSSGAGVPLTKAFISSIAEFPLSSPILSFCILDVAVRMYKTSDAYLIEELDDYDDENNALYCVVIHMFLVQPKSVQECCVLYQPSVPYMTDVLSTITSMSSEYRNISQSSSGSTTKDERVNNTPSVVDGVVRNAGSRLSTGTGSEKSLNVAEINETSSKEVEEMMKIIPANVSGSGGSVGASSVIPATGGGKNSANNSATANVGSISAQSKQPINLMTPDSFNSSGTEKSDNPKNDETVNPDVLNTLFMLANVTKQQQLKNSEVSPNGNLTEKPSPLSVLNIVNSAVLEEQEKAKVQRFVELRQKALSETPPVPPMPSAEMLASGGSSPSREIQEILSLKDNECYDSDNILMDKIFGIGEDELNDLENDIIEDEEEDNGYNFKNIDDDDDEDEILQRGEQPKQLSQNAQKVSEAKPTNHGQTHNYAKSESTPEKPNKSEPSNNIDWPKVPTAPHPTQSNFISPIQHPPPQAPMIVTMPNESKHYDDISQKLDRLLDVVQLQSRQITDLQSQIHNLNTSRSEDIQHYQSRIDKLEAAIPHITTEVYNKAHTQQMFKLEGILHVQNKTMKDDIIEKIRVFVTNSLVQKIAPIILSEIQRISVPLIGSKVDQITRLFKKEVAATMQADDAAFRLSIDNMSRSQAFIDALTLSIHTGVQKGLENTFKESLRNVILPGYERSTAELFQQLNGTFSAGTKEYLQKLDQYIAQQKQTTDKTEEIVELVKKVPDQVNASTQQQYKAGTMGLREDINRDFKFLQSNLLKVIRENIRHEIEKGLEAQASSLEDSVLSAVRSQAQTPAPSNVDIQEQIKQMLANGHINNAFHRALLSNDLSLVEFTLEKAEYRLVFNPCPLEQTVLLSLIQQISADMQNHNELKHRYLSDSIVSLNFLDPITKEHAARVMRELTQNCQNFLSTNPGSPVATNVKVLMIAIQGLGYNKF